MIAYFLGDDFPEPDQVFQIVKTDGPLFVIDGSTEIHTEEYSLTEHRIGNKWVVTYTPAYGPQITFETGSRPTYTVASGHPFSPDSITDQSPD